MLLCIKLLWKVQPTALGMKGVTVGVEKMYWMPGYVALLRRRNIWILDRGRWGQRIYLPHLKGSK